MQTILLLLGNYDLRMGKDDKERLVGRLIEMSAANRQELESDLSRIVAFEGPSDVHVSKMNERAASEGWRIVSPIELLRFGGAPSRFPAQSSRGNRNWHRTTTVLWKDEVAGDTYAQIIQPVEEDSSPKPVLELFRENFPIEGRKVIYLALPEKK